MNMKSFKKPMMATAVSLAMGLGVAGNAEANAYAYSLDRIFGLTLTGIPATPGLSYLGSSSSDANVNGSADADGSTGPCTAAQIGTPACVEPAAVVSNSPASNPAQIQTVGVFTAFGDTNTTYSWGGAQIVSQQVSGDPSTEAINAAESSIVGTGFAISNATNTSATGFTLTFDLPVGTTISFDFNAAPFLQVDVDDVPSGATADLDVSFTIQDSAGVTVFSWTPDGVLGSGISGIGTPTETADDTSLNRDLSRFLVGTSTIDPVAGIGTPACSGGVCDFTASTGILGPGTGYRLTLSMHEGTVASETVIPEIDAVAGTGALTLLGGMLALAGERRRRRA